MCFKKCVLKTYVLEYIVFSILFYSWKYENYFGNFCIIKLCFIIEFPDRILFLKTMKFYK